jgi:hypothetical protein
MPADNHANFHENFKDLKYCKVNKESNLSIADKLALCNALKLPKKISKKGKKALT